MCNMSAPVGSVSNHLVVNYGILRSGTAKLRSQPPFTEAARLTPDNVNDFHFSAPGMS
jgi:hypothetical protein